jgi:hypothetical protein
MTAIGIQVSQAMRNGTEFELLGELDHPNIRQYVRECG